MLKIKPVFRCEEGFKPQFSQAKCLLTISVGQEVHEGEKFLSTIALVDKYFGACVMLIDDTLQRHTMALELGADSGEQLLFASLKEGDLWLKRNQILYSQMNIPLSIIRWNKWLEHPKYSYFKALLKQTYLSDLDYRASIEKTINQFLERYSRRHLDKNYVIDFKARQLCLDYLLEECAVMCLWPEVGCEFEVYPNYRNAAMEATHRRFILPDYPNLLHPVCIKFKNRGRFSSQKFEYLSEVMENSISG